METNNGLKDCELNNLAREFDHDGNGSIDIEDILPHFSGCGCLHKNLTLIMAESVPLDTYTTKLENIRKFTKKFKPRNGVFMVEQQ